MHLTCTSTDNYNISILLYISNSLKIKIQSADVKHVLSLVKLVHINESLSIVENLLNPDPFSKFSFSNEANSVCAFFSLNN